MTKDEIIEMADKAFDESSVTDAEILRFAKIITAKEREACAKLCDEQWERDDCAKAIRARGKK
jgi:hypothetical protein